MMKKKQKNVAGRWKTLNICLSYICSMNTGRETCWWCGDGVHLTYV